MRVSVVRSRQRFRYGLRQATSPLHLGQGSGHLPRLRSLVEQAAVRRFAIDLGGIDNCDGDRHLNTEAGGQEHTQWLAPVLAETDW